MFPKNAWYVATSSDEVQDKPLGRQICGISMVFYRDTADKITALEDFCPHRGAALSLGYTENDGIVCGYHGLKVGCKGVILAMPDQNPKKIPCVGYFAAVERHGFIWVWPGDSALADEGLIPEFEWENNPEWAFAGGIFNIKCNYKLMIDNLMDLTHEKYVHSSSIGQEELDISPVITEIEDGYVVTSRYMYNIIAPPFWQNAMIGHDLDPRATVDRWQKSRFVPPSSVLIDVGVALTGTSGNKAAIKDKVRGIVVDFITPETENTMWYFWGMARNFKPDDKHLTETIKKGQGGIFEEDLDVLEYQQKNHEVFKNKKLISLNIDKGGAKARSIISKMLKEERDFTQTKGKTCK